MTLSGLPYIDLAIAASLIFFLYKGFQRGFTQEFMRTLGTIVSLFVAIRYMSNISLIIIGKANLQPILAIVISFILLFVLTIYVFKLVADMLSKAISFSVALGNADKVVGGIFGLAKGAIIISLVIILLSFLNVSDFTRRHVSESSLFKPMQNIAPLAYNALKVFAPRHKPFLAEFEENFSGVSKYKKGKTVQKYIESLKKNKLN